ncbi:MAG: hypothetical protein D4S01_09680 [Dehalococcoidia bacterium]|nr:MAG: hypothetical protein D4S01_09680 [Dehalococcoidia bacterium]
MMPIVFSKHTEDLTLPMKNAVCVYHRQYAKSLPSVEGAEFVEFNDLCKNYDSYSGFKQCDAVVFVGINKMFNPSTRIHPVYELLPYGLPKDITLVSMDKSPYIGSLWRIWPHFYITKTPFGEYTYSYLLESHHNSFLDGVRSENPLDLNLIKQHADKNVQIDYDQYFSLPKIEIIEMSPDIHSEYQELKEELFNEHDRIVPIIRGLANFAKSECKERKIPMEHKIFETPNDVQIVRTDLKVDEYLANKLMTKIDEVNRVCEMLQ